MIRAMRERDVAAIMEIEEQSFTSHWSSQQMMYELYENDFAFLYVLEEQDEILGYIDFWITFDTCQLASIAVRQSARRRGVAKQLMEYMIQSAQQKNCDVISLEVRVSNESAIHMYQTYGFIEASIRKNYYSDNYEDAILMVKGIGGES